SMSVTVWWRRSAFSRGASSSCRGSSPQAIASRIERSRFPHRDFTNCCAVLVGDDDGRFFVIRAARQQARETLGFELGVVRGRQVDPLLIRNPMFVSNVEEESRHSTHLVPAPRACSWGRECLRLKSVPD